MSSLFSCLKNSCINKLTYKNKIKPICVLIWNKSKNDKSIYTMNYKESMASNLFGKTYIDNSNDYIFKFGSGIIGNIAENKESSFIHVAQQDIQHFHRRDLALRCHINYIEFIFNSDNDTVIEYGYFI